MLTAALPDRVRNRRLALAGAALAGAMALAACQNTSGLSGTVEIDGSSTVFPIMEAVAEEFSLEHRGARVTVGVSGTGGGFKRFCNGETDISNASRPIQPSEIERCAEGGWSSWRSPSPSTGSQSSSIPTISSWISSPWRN